MIYGRLGLQTLATDDDDSNIDGLCYWGQSVATLMDDND